MGVLVTGASGLIGNRIFSYFKEKGYATRGTYHSQAKPKLLKLDLGAPDFEELELSGTTHAIICSGFTRMDECKTREAFAKTINVTGTIRLIEHLQENKVVPVFLSTNYVFSGEKGDYAETDKRDATMQYGLQKCAVEEHLEANKFPYLIVRISHAYSLRKSEPGYLSSIIEDLRANKTIRAATDQRFSPTQIDDVPLAIERLIENESTGCYHLASSEAFTRFELATKIKSELAIEQGEIKPCSIKDFDFAEPRPLDTSLRVDKIRNETNLTPKTLSESLRTYIGRAANERNA